MGVGCVAEYVEEGRERRKKKEDKMWRVGFCGWGKTEGKKKKRREMGWVGLGWV